jgi:TolB-like protein
MQPAAEGVIREHLDKVLTSAGFQNSERLRRFLRFIVDAKLRGEPDRVKEYLIGKEVFDRDSSYDPRLDPIVRVEARRLRKKLEAYYEGPGSGDAIRIELPKGGYIPAIRQPSVAAPEPVLAGPRKRNWLKISAALAFICAACFAAAYFRPRPAMAEPIVAVVPARWIWTGNDFPDLRHDEDLAERIGATLATHKELRVLSWPSIQRFRSTGRPTSQLAPEFAVTRVIIVAVRLESDGFRVTAYLIDPKQDRKLNVTDKRGVALDTPANRQQAAAQLADSCLMALNGPAAQAH